MKLLRVISVVGATIITTTALTACSSPASTTCADYAAKTTTQQTLLVRDLIKSHGLDPDSNYYAVGKIQADIDMFCGYFPGGTAAKSNQNVAIDKAIDWNSYKK